jgi:hypothetical protein
LVAAGRCSVGVAVKKVVTRDGAAVLEIGVGVVNITPPPPAAGPGAGAETGRQAETCQIVKTSPMSGTMLTSKAPGGI